MSLQRRLMNAKKMMQVVCAMQSQQAGDMRAAAQCSWHVSGTSNYNVAGNNNDLNVLKCRAQYMSLHLTGLR